VKGWDAVEAGFRLPEGEASVDAARQARHHAACDVPAGLFGAVADASILGQDTALAARRAGLPLDGRIHLRTTIRQHAPAPLGEALAVSGVVVPFGPSPRGRVLNARFAFARAGATLVEMDMQYLLPGPSSGEAAPRAEAAAEAFAAVARLALTPDKVTGYSREVGNLIHFDPDFAKAAGFRAPLAQGQMQATAALGCFAGWGLPDAFTLDCRYLRPLFWDDDVRIEATADRSRLRFVAPDGRIAGTAALSGCPA